MTGVVRIGAACGAIALLWLVAGSRIQSHERLPLSAIVPGAVMTQPFGCTTFELEPFDPFCPARHIHTGIDLAAPEGTAVYVAAGGTAHVGFDPRAAGLYVLVAVDQHVRVLYCHLSSAAVMNGAAVATGQVIGAVGSTGLSTGAHLHFEVQVDGRSIDPVAWLSP